jgi:hypothetical protein
MPSGDRSFVVSSATQTRPSQIGRSSKSKIPSFSIDFPKDGVWLCRYRPCSSTGVFTRIENQSHSVDDCWSTRVALDDAISQYQPYLWSNQTIRELWGIQQSAFGCWRENALALDAIEISPRGEFPQQRGDSYLRLNRRRLSSAINALTCELTSSVLRSPRAHVNLRCGRCRSQPSNAVDAYIFANGNRAALGD